MQNKEIKHDLSFLSDDEWCRVLDSLEYHYDTGETLADHDINCNIANRLRERLYPETEPDHEKSPSP